MSCCVTETKLGSAALEWLTGMAYTTKDGPYIAPVKQGLEGRVRAGSTRAGPKEATLAYRPEGPDVGSERFLQEWKRKSK